MTFSEKWANYLLTFGPFDSSYVEADFREQFAEMWNAATEQAAKVAESKILIGNDERSQWKTWFAVDLAAAIRSGKEADRGTE